MYEKLFVLSLQKKLGQMKGARSSKAIFFIFSKLFTLKEILYIFYKIEIKIEIHINLRLQKI